MLHLEHGIAMLDGADEHAVEVLTPTSWLDGSGSPLIRSQHNSEPTIVRSITVIGSILLSFAFSRLSHPRNPIVQLSCRSPNDK